MEEELVFFWETEDIWDRDGDLLVASLLWMYVKCIEESLFITYDYYDFIELNYKERI